MQRSGAIVSPEKFGQYRISRRPTRLLQFDLAFKSLGQIDDQQLDKRDAQSIAGNHVQIVLGPNPNDLDTAPRPDPFPGLRNLSLLDTVAAHDVHQS